MCHDLVNIIAILHASLLRVTDLKQISKFRRQYMSTVSGTWVRSSHCVNSCEYFLWIPPLTHPVPASRALPRPMMYACIRACLRRRQKGREGWERDWERSERTGCQLALCAPLQSSLWPVKGGDIQGFVTGETCGGVFKGEYNLKINLCASPLGWTHKNGLIKW